MAKIRAPHDESQIENGLIVRKLPSTQKLYFQEGTQDIFEFKRKSPLQIDDEFKLSHKAVLDMDSNLKRRKLKPFTLPTE